MNLVLRFFMLLVLLEMMMVYHCFGSVINRYQDILSYSAQEVLLQSDHNHSAPDFYEISEIKEANESDEEESDKQIPPSKGLITFSIIDFSETNLQIRLQDYKNDVRTSETAFFILYHSWKFHL